VTRAERSRPRRRDRPPAGQVAARGLAVAVVLAAFGFLATRLYDGVPGRDYGEIHVSAPLVGNLLPHDAVRIGGVRVGQVLDRGIGQDGRPRLKLQLEPGVTVPADTTVAVRASGLLGARFVELVPGRDARDLARGETLRGDEDALTFGLPEALEVFDRRTRAGLKATIDELGPGLVGTGRPLNATIATLGRRTDEFEAVAEAVLEREGAAARLLPSLRSAVEPLDRNRDVSAEFNDEVRRALAPFESERGAVRATLTAAPAALDATARGLADGQRLLGAVRGLSTEAQRTLPVATPGLRSLGALLQEGRAPVRAAAPLVRTLERAVPGVIGLGRALDPLLPRLDEALEKGTPIVDFVGERGCDIITFGTSMRSMTGFGQTGSGPGGPAMAFRLQAFAPLTPDVLGVTDVTGQVKRDGYSPPCRYPSTEYPQFVPKGAGR
jgi:ABC-type transporter Mla subunit MlaD